MAQKRIVPPFVVTSVWPGRLALTVVTSAVVMFCAVPPSWASRRPPVRIPPIADPGFGVPDEPDGPNPGGMLRPLSRPLSTTSVTHGQPQAPRPLQLPLHAIRTLKARRIWR